MNLGLRNVVGWRLGYGVDLELRHRWAADDLGTEWGVQRRREENRV